MISTDAEFITACIRRYYFERFSTVELPPHMEKREFGYQRHDSGMIRHIQMDKNDLLPLLMREAPTDVYASNARYLFPALPMSDKEWQDADIIFDIDAKDLNAKCRSSHTVHVCSDCGLVGTDLKCSFCDSNRTTTLSLPCNNCMDQCKKEVEKLIDILEEDLGIESGIRVYFSGNDGYHIHVTSSALAKIKSRERHDLTDYIRCRGLMPDTLGMKKSNATVSLLPRLDERGWRGRFARGVFGSKSGRHKKAPQFVRAGYDSMERVIDSVSRTIGVCIDPNVTSDVHRIFRMPGTINGKSSLVKIRCADMNIDPYVHAVQIHSEETGVRATCPIQFTLRGMRFGPYSNEYVQVPAFAAAYMICKGVAHIEES